jgi:two-component system, OmpR family, sensor kinase
MRSRLRFSLYLGALVLVFVIGGHLLSFRLFAAMPVDKVDLIACHVAENIFSHRDEPGGPQRYLRELRSTPVSLTLFDRELRLIASTREPAPSAAELEAARRDPTPRHRVHQIRSGGLHGRGSGELLGYALLDRGPARPDRPFFGLFVLLFALALLVVAITLHVGPPLQRIASAARAFGRGDLKARTGLVRKDELGDVGRAFDEMADRVTSLMAAERELMANISHELQTPLARIRVAVDLLCDGISDRAIDLLPEISRDLGEIDRLIDDVMTNARLDFAAGTLSTSSLLRRQPAQVAEMIVHAEARFFALHPERALFVDQPAYLPTLDVDPVLVRRALENLLTNAAKYSAPPAAITLRVSLTASAVVFEIIDLGIGIDPGDLPNLFTPFFRTDRSRSRATGGTGLGLGLARRIAQAHGGRLSLESAPHQGTTVTLELPLLMA